MPRIEVIEEPPEDPSIRTLGLGARAYGALRRAGLNTVGKLLIQTEEDLLACWGIGKETLADVREAMRLAGYELAREALREKSQARERRA